MIQGHVRDDFPYVSLSLPGRDGPINVEFIVDTGFNGDLALPSAVLSQMEATFSYERDVLLADGTQRKRPYFEILVDWNEEPRLTEVMVLEGVPLLGGTLLSQHLIQIEMMDGGEVSIEPL